MFKSKVLLAGFALALVSGMFSGITVLAHEEEIIDEVVSLTELPADVPEDVVAYVTTDGGKHWTPIKEEKGVAERMPPGMTKEQFMIQHAMPPEAEAAIIHEVPRCSIIIDGVLYEPEQIHLFDGQRLGFIKGNDGQLYAFTTYEALVKFKQEQREQLSNKETSITESTMFSNYSNFYEDVNF